MYVLLFCLNWIDLSIVFSPFVSVCGACRRIGYNPFAFNNQKCKTPCPAKCKCAMKTDTVCGVQLGCDIRNTVAYALHKFAYAEFIRKENASGTGMELAVLRTHEHKQSLHALKLFITHNYILVDLWINDIPKQYVLVPSYAAQQSKTGHRRNCDCFARQCAFASLSPSTPTPTPT